MSEAIEIITLEEFQTDLRLLHDTVFSGREYSNDPSEKYLPFTDLTWKRVLVPNNIISLDTNTFSALANTAIKMGDDRIIVTESESLPHNERTVRVTWDKDILYSLRDFSDIAHFELHAFGMSATWGLMCYYDEFSLLGGTSAFMGAFLESAGGMQRVRERFIQYALEIWVMDPVLQVQILKSVGWSFSDA